MFKSLEEIRLRKKKKKPSKVLPSDEFIVFVIGYTKMIVKRLEILQ